MNGEELRKQDEAVMVYLNVLSQQPPEETVEKNAKFQSEKN